MPVFSPGEVREAFLEAALGLELKDEQELRGREWGRAVQSEADRQAKTRRSGCGCPHYAEDLNKRGCRAGGLRS